MVIGIQTLPVEMMGDVLRRLDSVSTLAVCVRTSPIFWRALQQNSQVCCDILRSRIEPELLPYAIATHQARRRRELGTNTVQDTRALLDKLYNEPASMLPCLTKIDYKGLLEIDGLHSIIQRYAQEMAVRAIEFIATGRVGIKMGDPASTSELQRISLAFYRVELYMQLFGVKNTQAAVPSFELQNKLFFSRHLPWVNEQLACIHDFMEWKLSRPLHSVASHDIAFGKLSVDYISTGVANPWMQNFMSHGLFFIESVATAGEYEKEKELLWGSIGKGAAYLAKTLQWLTVHASGGVKANDVHKRLKKSNPKDDQGPYVTWCKVHCGEVMPGSIFLDSTYNLRQAAYVFWDEARLHKYYFRLELRLQYLTFHDEFWGPQPTEADRNKMIDSFRVRSELYASGRRGYYSG